MHRRVRLWVRLAWGLLTTGPVATAAEAPQLYVHDGEALVSGQITGADPARGVVAIQAASLRLGRTAARPLSPAEPATLLLPVACPTVDFSPFQPGAMVALTVTPGAPRPWTVRLVAVARPDQDAYQAELAPETVRVPYTQTTTQAKVVVPMVFPVLGNSVWRDTFLADRGGFAHLGQDLSAPRMTPLLACFDGIVTLRRAHDATRANTVIVLGDNGWQGLFTHLNNDTPGTKDNQGQDRYAFAPGLRDGQRVRAGQFLGWVGDSGDARGCHLHFELRRAETGEVHNAAASLRQADRRPAPVAPSSLPGLERQPGETRIDGVVDSIASAKNVVLIEVLTRSTSKGLAVVTRPERCFVKLGSAAGVTLSGAERLIPLAELRRGDPLAVVGLADGATLALRDGRVEIPGLLPGAALAKAVGSP